MERIDQTSWDRGGSLDYEHEHDGREPQGDEEPDIEADCEPPSEPFTTGGELPI